MAELLLCNKILENVRSLAVSVAPEGREQVQCLEVAISTSKAVLEGAALEGAESGAATALQLILHELDDQLEKIMVFHKQADTGNEVMNKACLLFSLPNEFAPGAKMVRLAKKFSQDLENTASECEIMRKRTPSNKIASGGMIRREETRSYMHKQDVIGLEEDRKVLVDMLLDSKDKVDVIAMVGIAGVGKTTLAKLVYNDRRVTIQFELRGWACVSDKLNFEDTMRRIILSVYRQVDPRIGIDQLRSHLLNAFRGKIFLLVLDDLCEGCLDKWWLDLRGMLSEGARGSKILVTTQSGRVAQIVGNTRPYELRGLSPGDSWSLFEKLAFGDINCNELSADLKACLAYCALLPTDYDLNKHDLISLWMAQGFIQPRQQNQSLENAGEENFLKLLRRGFFQDVKKGELGEVLTFRKRNMCDLAACQMIFGSTVSTVLEADTNVFQSRIRHVSFYYERDPMWKIPSSLFKVQKLRTFLWMKAPADSHANSTEYMCNKLISSFRCLRVLDLHDFGIEELPSSINELSHLRYLDLSNNDLVKLPESITRLYYLQTLKLNFCEKLRRLPKGIGRLINLRRLEIDECGSLIGIPLGLGKLKHIQTLSRFIVGKAGSSPECNGGLRVLNGLNDLTGRLTLDLHMEWATVLREAEQADLRSKSRLSELRIDWGIKRSCQIIPSQYRELLEGIQPPQNLKLLCIKGYRGDGFPRWASTSQLAFALPNLVVLSIEGGYEGKHLQSFHQLPSFHQLSCLKRLTLRFMDDVQYMECNKVPASEPFFPSLEELTIHSLTNLKGWWEVEAELEQQPFPSFSRLLKLKIWNCPQVMHMPFFPHIEDLDLLNVSQKLLQDARASSSAADATSSMTSCSLSCSSSITIGFQILPHLRRLQIKGCSNLKSLPALAVSKEPNGLSSLKYLVVDKCDQLRSLTEGLQHFSSLEELEIAGCKELDFSLASPVDGMPWKSLSCLRYLTFHDIPKMEKLPDGLKHVSTLRYLCVSSCNNLASLPDWMSCLTSLVHFRIECCPLLKTLPEALRDLHSLVKVEITECPTLVERCREHSGEEWDKIKHARVLLHRSWRYGLLSDAGQLQQKLQNQRTITGGTCSSRRCDCLAKTCNCSCHRCCHCQ